MAAKLKNKVVYTENKLQQIFFQHNAFLRSPRNIVLKVLRNPRRGKMPNLHTSQKWPPN